jgi:sensor histidine kinase YesM
LTKEAKKIIRMLGFSLLVGLAAGLVFGYFYNQYLIIIIIAVSISLTIWVFQSGLTIFLLPKIKDWPRKKRILVEFGAYFLASLLGFLIPIAVLSSIFRFSFFGERVFLMNLLLLLVFYLMFSGIGFSLRLFKELREKEVAEEKLKTLAAKTQLQALKSQIRPHFLFNTLNSISALVKNDPDLSRKMIAHLSELLRISLENHDKLLVPLKKELDFVHLYLNIERVRFREKMRIDESIDPDVLDVNVPTMFLQPLVENAVKHGIAKSRSRGRIRLLLERNGDRLTGQIINTVGKGNRPRTQLVKGNGTGLSNIRQRLDLLFKDEYSFQAGYTEKGVFEVRFSFPILSSGS